MSSSDARPRKVRGRIPSLIFGPVHSRRYGVSLGVNLLPPDRKICNFNCPYCECGWTEVAASRAPVDAALFAPARAILADLEEDLAARRAAGERIDAITFAGNGEPTLHPEFGRIAREARVLRNRHFPGAALVLLSASTNMREPGVREGLDAFDVRVMKLDAGTEGGFRAVNLPVDKVSLASIVEDLAGLDGRFVLQAMFVRGRVDNTAEGEVSAWLRLVAALRPESVQVYSLDRTPPDPGIERVPREALDAIVWRVTRETGIPAEVY